MNKKENRMAVRQTVEKTVIRGTEPPHAICGNQSH